MCLRLRFGFRNFKRIYSLIDGCVYYGAYCWVNACNIKQSRNLNKSKRNSTVMIHALFRWCFRFNESSSLRFAHKCKLGRLRRSIEDKGTNYGCTLDWRVLWFKMVTYKDLLGFRWPYNY